MGQERHTYMKPQKQRIFREQKDKNYSVIRNPVFYDDRISWGAKGVLGYALTKPDDWSLYISEVVKHGTDKEFAVSGFFKELRLAGYIEYVQIREKGKIISTEYVVYEKPLHNNPINIVSRYKAKKQKELNEQSLFEPNREKPRQEKLEVEKLEPEKHGLLSTDNKLSTDFVESTKTNPPSLEPVGILQKCKTEIEKAGLTFNADRKSNDMFLNQIMMEFGATNEVIEEQLKKLIYVVKNEPFKKAWMKESIGFKTLKFHWSDIDALYNNLQEKEKLKAIPVAVNQKKVEPASTTPAKTLTLEENIRYMYVSKYGSKADFWFNKHKKENRLLTVEQLRSKTNAA